MGVQETGPKGAFIHVNEKGSSGYRATVFRMKALNGTIEEEITSSHVSCRDE